MSEYYTRFFGTYSGKSDTEIDDFRDEYLGHCENQEIGGTFILGEGGTWVRLEGDHNGVYIVRKALLVDDFFDTVDADDIETLHTQHIQEVYLYYEDKPPVTSL